MLEEKSTKELNPNWNFVVKINELTCLAYHKTLCCTCKDICYSILGKNQAIAFSGLFYPEIQGNCIGCGECAKVCPKGVLEEESAKEQNPNWNFVVKINALTCLAYHKTLCCTCKDICYSILGKNQAIAFSGLFYPEIQGNCIGCGECIGACPARAIVLESKE